MIAPQLDLLIAMLLDHMSPQKCQISCLLVIFHVNLEIAFDGAKQ